MSKKYYLLLILPIILGFFVFDDIEQTQAQGCRVFDGKWTTIPPVFIGDTVKGEISVEGCAKNDQVFVQFFADGKGLGKEATFRLRTLTGPEKVKPALTWKTDKKGKYTFDAWVNDSSGNQKSLFSHEQVAPLNVSDCGVSVNFTAQPTKVDNDSSPINLKVVVSLKGLCGEGVAKNVEIKFLANNKAVGKTETKALMKGDSVEIKQTVTVAKAGAKQGSTINFQAEVKLSGSGAATKSQIVAVGVGVEPEKPGGGITGAGGSTGGEGSTGKPGETKTTTFEVRNPIAADNFIDLVKIIGQWIFNLAIPIAVIMILYAGFLWLTAGARPANVAKAKTVFWYAILGLVIIFIGQGFLTLIKSILELGG